MLVWKLRGDEGKNAASPQIPGATKPPVSSSPPTGSILSLPKSIGNAKSPLMLGPESPCDCASAGLTEMVVNPIAQSLSNRHMFASRVNETYSAGNAFGGCSHRA